MSGDSQPQPQQQAASSTTQTAELPEWARPYAKDTLEKAAALTDVNQNPYQQYTQNRIAGFSPLQQQAQQQAAGMTVAPQTSQATAAAAGAGLGGLNVAGQAGVTGFQNQIGGYMNPYLSQILAPQLAEANRNYDIGATKQQSAATQAGAFGGSREAIMAAENERNRNMGLNQIYGQGLNTAYTNAQNQFNQNLQSQLAGYGLANQSAATLGQLGQNQYGQQMGINQLQNQYGAQQQAQEQQGLSQAYQDFLNQQNYPYKQLGFMSDMIRGLPLGQQSTQSIYQAPPSALQTVGALGMGAYGAKQLGIFAEGGQVHGYAGGGVTSQGNVENILSKLSDAQLAQAKQMALAQRDAAKAEMIDTEMRERAIARNGISGTASNSMVDNILPTQESMARGGIVAFSGDDEETGQLVQGPQMVSSGAPDIYRTALQRTLAAEQGIGAFQPKQLTQEQLNAAIKQRYELEKGLAGEDVAGKNFAKYIEESRAERAGSLDQAKGLAALKAAAALSQGNNLVRGLGAAGSEFASTYGQALQADRTEKRALANMEFNLADAQRKERMGMTRSAVAAAAEAQKNQKDADAAHLNKLKYQGDLAGKAATAAKPYKAAGAGAGEKPLKVPEQLSAAEIAFEKDPTEANLRTVTALRRTVAQTKTSDIGTNKSALEDARLMSAQDAKVLDKVNKAEEVARISPEYLKAKDKPAYLKGVKDKARQEARETFRSPAKIEGLPAGATVKGNEVYDSTGNLIGHIK